MPIDQALAADAIRRFLCAIGRDPEHDPELSGTPERVAEAWASELLDGYEVDVADLLRRESTEAVSTGVVAVRDLDVFTMCPHHLLPARGTAAIVYQPATRLAGIGTLARVVDAFGHRLALQENITRDIAAALVVHLGAKGALCKLSLAHDCLSARGPRKTGAVVETIEFAGSFATPGPDRDVALAALGARE